MKKPVFRFLPLFSLLLAAVIAVSACPALADASPWDCPKCGSTGNTGNFCPVCGSPAPQPAASSWDCPQCGHTGNTWNFCPSCGAPRPDAGKEDNTVTAQNISYLQALRTVGSVVKFGHYEQENSAWNGREPIEWVVLDVQDGRCLLLSRYGLDKQPYNTSYSEVSWATCTLRRWLEDTFLPAAFTAEEQSLIRRTVLDNSRYQCYYGWNTDGGYVTQDKVFLLSYAEANRYLGVAFTEDDSNTAGRAAPSIFALAKGTKTYTRYKTAEGRDAGCWWLRSPGKYRSSAAEVYADGTLTYFDVNDPNNQAGICVRPALWLNLWGPGTDTEPVTPPQQTGYTVRPYQWDTQFRKGNLSPYNDKRYLRLGNIDDDDYMTSFDWLVWSGDRTDDIPELTAYFRGDTVSSVGIRNGYLRSESEYYLYARASGLIVKIYDRYGGQYSARLSIPDEYTTDYRVFSLGRTYTNVTRIEFWLDTYRSNQSADLNHRNVLHIADIRFYN